MKVSYFDYRLAMLLFYYHQTVPLLIWLMVFINICSLVILYRWRNRKGKHCQINSEELNQSEDVQAKLLFCGFTS